MSETVVCGEGPGFCVKERGHDGQHKASTYSADEDPIRNLFGAMATKHDLTVGCWVVLSSPDPVTATVFASEGAAYKHAYENHAASVHFLKWGETT